MLYSLVIKIFFSEKGKLTTEEDFGQRKDSFAVFWDYVKAGGGCSSIMVVAFCLLLYGSGVAFANFWVSLWLEAGSGVRNTFLIYNLATYFSSIVCQKQKITLFCIFK